MCLITWYKIQEANSSELNKHSGCPKQSTRAEGGRGNKTRGVTGWKARHGPFSPEFSLSVCVCVCVCVCVYTQIYTHTDIYICVYIYIYIYIYFFFFFREETHSCLVLWRRKRSERSLWCRIRRVSQMQPPFPPSGLGPARHRCQGTRWRPTVKGAE